MRNVLASAVCCLLLSACATIVNGSSQSVTVSTDPPGASCRLTRHGETVGAVAVTPGSVEIGKSKNDLNVTCERPGYQTATISKSPSFGGATFGNIIAGGVVGVVVDAASGANYTYPSEMHLAMAPIQPAAAIASQQTGVVQPRMTAGVTAGAVMPASATVPIVPANKPDAG